MKRAYEALLNEFLELFPCVAVIGPRQCGKTTLIETLTPEWRLYDLERDADHQIIADDPDLFLRLNPKKVIIDEAQILPDLFPALRVAVDQDRNTPGRYVITGSSSPNFLKQVSESLAGRVGIIEMAPFSWLEVSESQSPGPLSLILDRSSSAKDLLAAASPRDDIQAVHDYWLKGGYPEPWIKSSERFRKLWTDQYVRTYLYRDIGRLFPRLNQDRFRVFLRLLGGLSGRIINYSEVSRALGVSQPTARDYFQIAHGTFIWRHLPAYTHNTVKRVVKHPRGYVRDTGLLHHLLRIQDLDQLLSHPQCGRSWEGLAIEEILRQLSYAGASVDPFFYRTSGGAEVDLVLEGDMGIIPIEIKRGRSVSKSDIRALEGFIRERGCRLGIVISSDAEARLYRENIVGLPFACL